MSGPADMIRARIARGTMPATTDRLLEMRGTMVTVAEDLVQFTGRWTVTEYLAALEEIYR